MKHWAAVAIIMAAIACAEPAICALGEDDARIKAGAAIYDDNCQACHNRDGSGQNPIFPPLAHNPIVQQNSAEIVMRVVLAGAQAVQTARAPTAAAMPSFAWRLSDQEVADVLTYIRNSWGNTADPVTVDSVRNARSQLQPR